MSLPLANLSPEFRATYERAGLSDLEYARPRTTVLVADTRAGLAGVEGITKATFARLDKRISSKKGMVESHLNNLAAVLAASPTNQSLSQKSLAASHKLYKEESAKIWIVEWSAQVHVSYEDPESKLLKTKTDHVSSQQFEKFLVGYGGGSMDEDTAREIEAFIHNTRDVKKRRGAIVKRYAAHYWRSKGSVTTLKGSPTGTIADQDVKTMIGVLYSLFQYGTPRVVGVPRLHWTVIRRDTAKFNTIALFSKVLKFQHRMFADDRATHMAQATRYTCVEWLVANELVGSYHTRAVEAFFAGYDHETNGTTSLQLLAFIKSLGDVSLHLFSSMYNRAEGGGAND
ncbi:hypothetical protein B484DRAFT_395468 [Ochromonadaceae sp. CCMP2298]|nr:hypothetical protein B484DRAFT_395468 [Ochromonadaceae sp. CCMP2298]